MRSVFCLTIMLFSTKLLYAQNKISKPVLDTNVLLKFPYMGNEAISNDGRYMKYVVTNQPGGGSTLVIQSTESGWKKDLINIEGGEFSEDSKDYLYKIKDTLFFVSLGDESKPKYITNIETYKKPASGHEGWWAYQLKGKEKELVLQNRRTRQEQQFKGVEEYGFNDKGTILLLKITSGQNGSENELLWVDLLDNKINSIWSSKTAKIGGYSFDNVSKQLTFLTIEKNEIRPKCSVWYYKKGTGKAVKQVDDQTEGINQNLFIANTIPTFSASGQYIFFKITAAADIRKPLSGVAKLSIWSYKDSVIQSLQLKNRGERTYWASIAVNGDLVLQPEQDDEMVNSGTEFRHLDLILISNHVSIRDFWWASFGKEKKWLVSLKDGSRKLLPFSHTTFYSVSPTGRYLVYYEPKSHSYYSYDTARRKTADICTGVPSILYDKKGASESVQIEALFAYGIAGWLEDGSAVFVYDEYDIWQLDPFGLKPPVNLTHGLGRRHAIRLRLLAKNIGNVNRGLDNNSNIILTALDSKTQQTGYYRMTLGRSADPEQLNLDACAWGSKDFGGIEPLKARDADKWIVSKQTSSESPDYYFTTDFSRFKRLTHLQPQQNYNWFTTELINWKRADGLFNQGLLFKPEDFDQSKKYPVIFVYYDKKIQERFQYIRPGYNAGDPDVAWLVSHGYIVCEPDIHYAVNKPGQSAYLSVVSAARYLLTLPYVDEKSMAVSGHSFGGFETNYIISHSGKMFACAYEAAGTSDLISSYGAIRGRNGQEDQLNQTVLYENGQYRMADNLWENPKTYIENSPIFRADQVRTPLLIMHNKEDASVPWSQGMEWYAGLRRLQKPVWMLEYDGGGHLVGGAAGIDINFRMLQFFDHYLKGEPAPAWMTKGIPAKVKGIEMRYELDSAGNCGGSCKVCKKWNERYNGTLVPTSGNWLSKKETNQGQVNVFKNRPKPTN
ncbi:MAG: prolyl oligopeptidase family serine peptidase [Bacteroidota bacterium]